MNHRTLVATGLLLLGALVAPPPAPAQDAPAPVSAGTFSQADLEQLVAPIALYPDSLLMQIFMASTYPLEVVEAQRWLAKNPGITGTKLEEGLKGQDWDPSVKGLCGFADVVKKMADNLDWTQDLGDAFLGQQAQLMDAVQLLRGKAYESGNLKSSKEQTVTQEEDKIIVIESSDPEVIYVPQYSPTVVYAGWGYPSYAYPAMYPPGYGALAFTAGVAWGAAVWGNANWGWGGGDVDIDVNKQNNFNRNTSVQGGDRTNVGSTSGGKQKWSHDTSHRKGVNYGNSAAASKYGGSRTAAGASQADARGRSTGASTAGQRPSTGAGAGGQRPSTGAGTAGQRPSTGTTQRSSAGASASQRSAGSSAYSGARSGGGSASSASSRGASSRGSTSYGGGGSRGGGGGGGARGGGGGGGRR